MAQDDEKNNPPITSWSSEKSFGIGTPWFNFHVTVKTSESYEETTLVPCKVEMISDKKRIILLHLVNNDDDWRVKIATISKAAGKLEYMEEVLI